MTNIKFGPPKHLYPDNIDELFRINRNRKVSEDSTTRTFAKISPQEADLSQSKAEINGSEGDCAYERLVISDSENAQRKTRESTCASATSPKTTMRNSARFTFVATVTPPRQKC